MFSEANRIICPSNPHPTPHLSRSEENKPIFNFLNLSSEVCNQVHVRLNPHLPNGLSHPYQLDESFFSFQGCLVYFFHFYQVFDRNSCEQTVETLFKRRILRRLIWVCTVCLCPKNGTPGLYGLNSLLSYRS